MSAIALRSPQYKTITAGANAAYTTCSITIDGAGSPQYVLRKNTSPSATVLFEISELCRDYLNITFNGTYTAKTITVSTVVNAYTSADALINGSTFY